MGTNKHTHAIYAYYTKDKYRSYDRTDTLITALYTNTDKDEEDGVMGFICEDEDYDDGDVCYDISAVLTKVYYEKKFNNNTYAEI